MRPQTSYTQVESIRYIDKTTRHSVEDIPPPRHIDIGTVSLPAKKPWRNFWRGSTWSPVVAVWQHLRPTCIQDQLFTGP